MAKEIITSGDAHYLIDNALEFGVSTNKCAAILNIIDPSYKAVVKGKNEIEIEEAVESEEENEVE